MFNKLEKEKQTKSKASRGKISAEMSEIENRKTKENINSNKNWFFDFTQTGQEKKITKTDNEKRDITTDL